MTAHARPAGTKTGPPTTPGDSGRQKRTSDHEDRPANRTRMSGFPLTPARRRRVIATVCSS